jgi:hypothetical protein
MASSERKTILILGKHDDPHVVYVMAGCKSRGEDVVIVDSSQYPGGFRLYLEPSGAWILSTQGRKIHENDVKSVYWRSYDGPRSDIGTLHDQHNWRSMFESWLIAMDPSRMLLCNGWDAYALHQRKPVQFSMAASHLKWIKVPYTVWSDHVDGVAGNVTLVKPVQGGTDIMDRREWTVDETRRGLPVTGQRMIEGQAVRVHCVGDKLFPIEIKSPHLDWRVMDPRTEYSLIDVEEFEEEEISELRSLTGLFSMNHCAFDLMANDEGQMYFLECNPSPMWMGFEQALPGVMIGNAFIDLLQKGLAK